MKKTHKLILAAVVAAGFTLGNAGKADESLLPPRAQALFPSIRASDSKDSTDLIRSQPISGNTKVQALRANVVARTASDPNLVQSVYTGKNAIRDASATQFEVAPLAKPGKQCEPGCTKACCVKK